MEPGVLLEQRGELADPFAQLGILADDLLAALIDDSGQGQIGDQGRRGHEPPGHEAIVVDLGFQVVGELVQLGDRDDQRRATRPDGHVDLEQVAPLARRS